MKLPALVVVFVGSLLLFSVPWSVEEAPYGFPAVAPHLEAYDASVTYASPPAPTAAWLILSPQVPFTDAEVDAAKSFLEEGGRMLVADDHGLGASLVASLDVGITLTGHTAYTPAYEETPDTPFLRPTRAIPGLGAFAARDPTIVTGAGEPVLLITGPAWIDTDGDQKPDLGEPRGDHAVARLVPVGDGALLVVGSPEVVLAPEGAPLLDWLAADRPLFLDEGHHPALDPIGMAPILAGDRPGLLVVAALAGLTASLFWVFRVRIERTRTARRRALQDAAWRELP